MMLFRLVACVLIILLMEVSGDEELMVASSYFWLKLSPTPFPLFSESIEVLLSSVNIALQAHILATNLVTLASWIDPYSSALRIDQYEVWKVNAVFRAVIFGNVTDAYTCIAFFALASVRTNNSKENVSEYHFHIIRSDIDDVIKQVLGPSTFLGQLLPPSPSNISQEAIVQLHRIESISIVPMTNSSSNGNVKSPPPPHSDRHQDELSHWDFVLITVSLVVLFTMIVPVIVWSRSSQFCRGSSSNESLEYPATSTPNIDLPIDSNNKVIPDLSDQHFDPELEVFAQSNNVSSILASSSILTLTNYDHCNNVIDPSNSCQIEEDYCNTDIMESLDATASFMFVTPSASSDDDATTAHSGSSSSKEMILALLSTASKTSPSSSMASDRSSKSNACDIAHHGTPSYIHEEMEATPYISSLASAPKTASLFGDCNV
jgi:hypothetical protein